MRPHRSLTVDRFTAISGDGRLFTLVISQQLIDIGGLNAEKPVWRPGSRRIATAEGHTCVQVAAGEYRILQLNLLVKRI